MKLSDNIDIHHFLREVLLLKITKLYQLCIHSHATLWISFPDIHRFVSCYPSLIYLLRICLLYCRPLMIGKIFQPFDMHWFSSHHTPVPFDVKVAGVSFCCCFCVCVHTMYHYTCSYPPVKHYYWCYNIMLHSDNNNNN